MQYLGTNAHRAATATQAHSCRRAYPLGLSARWVRRFVAHHCRRRAVRPLNSMPRAGSSRGSTGRSIAAGRRARAAVRRFPGRSCFRVSRCCRPARRRLIRTSVRFVLLHRRPQGRRFLRALPLFQATRTPPDDCRRR
jgi:hypothetical protein